MKKSRLLLISILLCLTVFVVNVNASDVNLDLGGKTIGIHAFRPDVTPLGPRGTYNFTNPDARMQAHIENVEEMFNVNIEFYSGWLTVEDLAIEIISGEDRIHFAHLGYTQLYPAAIEGLIHPLDNYLPDNYWDTVPSFFRSRAGLEVKGQLFGIEPENYTFEPMLIRWNKSFFEREGLPNLYKLFKNKEWTYDKLYEISEAINRDTTGDGIYDIIGLNIHRGIDNLYLTNKASLAKEKEGRITQTLDKPKMFNSLEFLQVLIQDEVGFARQLQPEKFTPDVRPETILYYFFPHVSMPTSETEDEFGLVPFPMGPDASDYVAPVFGRYGGVVPITVENPAAIIEVVTALYMLTEPYMEVDLETYEKQYWNNIASEYWIDKQSLEMWQWSFENLVVDMHKPLFNNIGWREAKTGPFYEMMIEGRSISAVIDEYKGAAQIRLDEIYQ